MDRIDKILELAAQSVFYQDSTSAVFRINYTSFGDGNEEGKDVYFDVVDEETGEEFRVFPEDVCDGDVFYQTVPVIVSDQQLDIAQKVMEQDSEALKKLADS